MTFLSGVLQKYRAQGLDCRAKKLTRRDTMGFLVFGAGTLLGLGLGIVLISLLSMAQKGDAFLDLMDRDKKLPPQRILFWGRR